MRYLLIVAAVLFLGGVAYNVLRAEPDFTNALAGLAITAVLGLVAAYLARREQEEWDFLAWALAQRELLHDGPAHYSGIAITTSSQVVRFDIYISLGILGLRERPGLVLEQYHSQYARMFAYCLITCLLGWWSLPMGPIRTIQVLLFNLRGGVRRTVEEELELFERRIAGE